ncbi:MAG: mechanosensitive ion channel [Candidatus Eisenbacteria bacterium]|uniref:Mechanosensitive ion channel n=1 Tax=Eiseniibacteriota bacterium TaxID=2212470 RepID=A0A956NB33_UNCEI|nr:mechanosensitive ion channel [Candidatus Eisenbacteria bacterium]MCB9462444.1 mechanosensitive ion channel [Candidatus Eisenbacteria bacterium]
MSRRRTRQHGFGILLALVCWLLLLPGQIAWAQAELLTGGMVRTEISAADSTSASTSSTADIRLRSPRATMMGFLDAINDVARGTKERIDDAVRCLDLESIPASIRSERAPQLAVELKEVIDRTRYVIADEIPDDAQGPPYVFLRRQEGEIVLAANERGEWRFTAGTVESIPTLLRATEDQERVKGVLESPLSIAPGLWVQSKVPTSLRTSRLWLEDWQWIGLFLLIFLGILLDRIVAGVVMSNLKRFLSRKKVTIAEKFLKDGLRPIGLLAMALTWWFGLRYLALPDRFFVVLLLAARLVAAVAGLWAGFRATDVIAEYLMKQAQTTESKLDDVLIPMFRKALKVFLTVIGILFIANSLDLDITAFLAGLGLGGLALALAAKDTIENLFGSLTVLLDRPFNVGDWIKLAGQEGTVTEVGFRSSRIRTFYDSVITIPNSHLINNTVDNMGARRYRRWSTKLGVQYDTTPEQIEAFCEGIREIIRNHPYTRKDYFHVYVNEFAASSLEILLYVFHEAPDWQTELRERHRLFLDILRLARRLGVQFAFPTQTLHMFRGQPPEDLDTIPPPQADDVDAAIGEGSALGKRIVRELLGESPEKPPPASSN